LADAALACATEVMSRVDEWHILQISLPVAIAQGDHERAARLLGAVKSFAEQLGFGCSSSERASLEAAEADIANRLGAAHKLLCASGRIQRDANSQHFGAEARLHEIRGHPEPMSRLKVRLQDLIEQA
jgi:hypothetical protein